jgi:hypothetical protein
MIIIIFQGMIIFIQRTFPVLVFKVFIAHRLQYDKNCMNIAFPTNFYQKMAMFNINWYEIFPLKILNEMSENTTNI